MELSLPVKLLVALGIGALIGLERQRSTASEMGGSRTFPLIALTGAVIQSFFPELLLISFVLLLILIAIAYGAKIVVEGDVGLTTSIASVLTFLFGAMTTHSREGLTMAVVLGTLTTVLLASKTPLHRFAGRIEKQEMQATLKFLIVALVVLPLLPGKSLPMLLGLNPRFVWYMVVFVSGISFAAYILSKFLGTRRGLSLTGILGGVVSSTATTLSMAQRAREKPDLYKISGIAILLASITMFPRAVIEIAVVDPGLVPHVLLPLGLMTAVGALLAPLVLWRMEVHDGPEARLANPFQLKPALLFGLLFGLILIATEYLHRWYGDAGVYGTAVLSGLVDVDAMAISLSKMTRDGQISYRVAGHGVVLVCATNTLVKGAIAWVIGTRQLGKFLTLLLTLVVAAGLGFTFLFPGG